MTQLHSHYVLTVNATGQEFIEPFTANNLHRIVFGAHESLASEGGLTHEQASHQLAIWNRSQAVHRQEFSYRLA